MIHYSLFQPSLSVAVALIAFGFIVWPGYAILHLLGLGRHRWIASVYAGPAVTIAAWIVLLSGTVWARIPLQTISPFIWTISLFLSVLGVFLYTSSPIKFSSGGETPGSCEERWQFALCWFATVFLSMTLMPTVIHYGLGIYASSICQDAWNYIAAADYFSHYARGTEGSFSPVDQYGSLFMNNRNASSVLLGYLANGLGVPIAEAISLYCLLVLFANGCALIAFAITIYNEFWQVIALVFLAGFFVPLLIVTYANLDQMLLLPMLPLLAVMALKVGRGEAVISLGVVIGILVAASIFAYVELAVLGLPVAASFILDLEQDWRLWFRQSIKCFFVTIPIATALTWSGLPSLITFSKSQYLIASQPGVRPGDGALAGWLANGEFIHLPWFGAFFIIGLAGLALTMSGMWFERRRISAVAALCAVASIVGYFALYEKYPYAVYKAASINFWLVIFFAISGIRGLLCSLPPRTPARRWAGPLTAAFAGISVLLFSMVFEFKLAKNALSQEGYREAVTVAKIVGDSPTILSVRDDAANQWAVIYLSAVPLLISPYRSTMGQPELRLIMALSRTIDPTSAKFVITDHDPAIRSTVEGAQLIWDGGTYSLWKLTDKKWSVIAHGGIHNDTVHLSNSVSP